MSQKIEFFPWYKITTWHSPPFVCLRDNKKPIPYWAIGMAVCQLPCCIDRLQRCHVLVAQFNVPSIFTLSADFPCPLSDAYHIMDPGLAVKKKKRQPRRWLLLTMLRGSLPSVSPKMPSAKLEKFPHICM